MNGKVVEPTTEEVLTWNKTSQGSPVNTSICLWGGTSTNWAIRLAWQLSVVLVVREGVIKQ